MISYPSNCIVSLNSWCPCPTTSDVNFNHWVHMDGISTAKLLVFATNNYLKERYFQTMQISRFSSNLHPLVLQVDFVCNNYYSAVCLMTFYFLFSFIHGTSSVRKSCPFSHLFIQLYPFNMDTYFIPCLKIQFCCSNCSNFGH